MMTLVSGELRSPLVRVQHFVMGLCESLLQRRLYVITIASCAGKRPGMMMRRKSVVLETKVIQFKLL